MHKKFIIYDGSIRLGHVDFHKELGPDKSLIKGGGWWHWDKENNIMYLYSSSMDFGYVDRNILIDAIENGMMRPSLEETKFFHSFKESLSDAKEDPDGIWITHKC
jgi:glyoxylase-like metal-dependent hydrolase (beta-lactamase superfamily II)